MWILRFIYKINIVRYFSINVVNFAILIELLVKNINFVQVLCNIQFQIINYLKQFQEILTRNRYIIYLLDFLSLYIDYRDTKSYSLVCSD